MSLTETISIPLGFKAPEFNLLDTISGEMLSLNDIKGKHGTVVMFICNHCPYVIHIREKLIELALEYQPQGIQFIAISSNDVINYPDDSPEKMRSLAMEMSFPFPYLFDETQDVAKAYHAACTPDFNLFDSNLKCTYRGRLDDSSPGNGRPVTGKELRAAMDSLLQSEPLVDVQIPSMGCNIKWR
jgi:peroxiredoxin